MLNYFVWMGPNKLNVPMSYLAYRLLFNVYVSFPSGLNPPTKFKVCSKNNVPNFWELVMFGRN